MLLEHLNRSQIQAHVVLLKTDFPFYVVHCTTESTDGTFPKYTHGAGAALSINVAIARAITECIQLRTSQIKIFQNQKMFEDDLEYKPYIEWGIGNTEYVGSLMGENDDEGEDTSNFIDRTSGTLSADINFIKSELFKRGYITYVSSLTRIDNPISTVRVIIPGLQPADDTLRRTSKRMKQFSTDCSNENIRFVNKRELFS